MRIREKVEIYDICFQMCLDFKGNNAIKVYVITKNHFLQTAILPYWGENKSHLHEMNQIIKNQMIGVNIFNQKMVDEKLSDLFKTLEEEKDKTILLGISIAVCRMAAESSQRELFEYVGGISGGHLPQLMIRFPKELELICLKKVSLRDNVKMGRDICALLESVQQKELKREDIFNACQESGYDNSYVEVKEKNDRIEERNIFWIDPLEYSNVSEIIHAIRESKAQGGIPILMGDSFNTEDSFLADLAVGLNLKYVMFGKPSDGGNHEKYNRLIEIETFLGKN